MTLLEKETIPQKSYKYISDIDDTWYSFITKNEVHYEVVFYKSPALFCEYPLIGGVVYELSILTSFDKPPLDYSVQLTIIEIVRQFLDSNKSVLLFICDSVDGNHHKRQVKFDRWIDSADLGADFEKHDGCITFEGTQIFNTIIIKSDFELKKNVLEAFFEINDN